MKRYCTEQLEEILIQTTQNLLQPHLHHQMNFKYL